MLLRRNEGKKCESDMLVTLDGATSRTNLRENLLEATGSLRLEQRFNNPTAKGTMGYFRLNHSHLLKWADQRSDLS